MSNLNDYLFAETLKVFEQKVVLAQRQKVDDATAIMNDTSHEWRDDAQKETGRKQLEAYKIWLAFYEKFYAEGLKLCTQHESLTNKMSKIYDSWYKNISNEGRQETELMQSQADILNELMGELYKELAPLKLEGMKPPALLNMK